jgi:hypothetical protein
MGEESLTKSCESIKRVIIFLNFILNKRERLCIQRFVTNINKVVAAQNFDGYQ